MNKNILRFLLSAVLLMCSVVTGAVGIQPSKGDGTKSNPYQIAIKEHLLWFADHVNQGNLTACAILTVDITVNSNVLNSDGSLNSGTFETWTPIGNWGDGSGYNGFAGEFNGNGHTISGLYFNDETKAPVGLFGIADNNGYIHDVGIKDSYFRGMSHVAGICGDLAKGKIENCWNGATVIAPSGYVGGIAGSCWHSSSISGCYNIGKVSSTNSNVCGGICGSVAKNPNVTYSVSNCVSLEGKCDRAYNIGEEGAKVIDVYILDASTFASGEACWKLNGEKIDTKWRQQIGTDNCPVLTGNYLVNYYSGSPSYCYNETMCENSENLIHNFENKTTIGCDGSKFTYWHCTHCGKNYSYEGEGGHANQTKELSAGETSAHIAEWVPAVLPTSTTTGRYGYWHCTVCGKNFIDEQCTVEATEANLTVPVVKNNEIWYTTTDNEKLTPNKTDTFGAKYNDNVYEKGLGKITFDTEVTIIGEQAFMDCSRLTNIGLPNSVKEIAKYAFGYCSNLITAHLPEGVSNIGIYAFADCSQLQSITIPGSVKSMGKYVFSGCTSLSNVTIEDGAYIGAYVFMDYTGSLTINGSLSGVGQFAFMECTGLHSVSVKSGSIGQQAFKKCTNLSTATLDGVTAIGTSAFEGCSQLQSITIPGSVKSMENDVFLDCNSLKNVTIEDGAYIGMRVFQNYTGALTINGSLSGVGANAFDGCTALTSVSVKSGSIGGYAFYSCTGLTSVTLLEDVTSIYSYAFFECSNLKDIFVKWTEAEKMPYIEFTAFHEIDLSKVTLHVPSYTTALYQTKNIWKDFKIVEDVNVIITKTDGSTVEQKLKDGDEVTIDESEGDIKSLVVSEEFTNVSVTYIRNFANADKWQGWYVPFDVPVSDMAEAGFEVAEIYGILLDNSGNTVLAFLKMDTGTVKANTPYVVRPKESGKVTLTTSKTTIRPSEDTKFTIDSAEDTYTIGGIYEQTKTPGNWYAINKEGQFQKMGTGVNLRPMRIWMTIDPREDNPYATKSGMNMMVISKGQIYTVNGKNYLAQ